MLTPALAATARRWADDDPDAGDRAAVLDLLQRGGDDPAAAQQLAAWFAEPLTFGTAGLRGPVRPGPAGMNRAVVRRAAAALADLLTGERLPTPLPPLVVIGRDARHGSEAFARDTALVLSGAELRVLSLPRPLPTPVTAFAARQLAADAAVMVTASHNPATDNGYKVYLPDAQLVPPHDVVVEAGMRAVGSVLGLALGDGGELLGEEIVEAYLEATLAAVLGSGRPKARRLRIAVTPLHGVGGELALRVLTTAGFPAPSIVAEQAEPDPDFPTVAFPNPEEPGAMDAVLALGERVGAELVLAVDPDADRLAAAEDGRVFTGDEVGALLADRALARGRQLVATTVVSSRLLARLAAAAGAPYAETLTGFKWLMRATEPGGTPLGFACEEALGYAVAPAVVRDKDGLSAALALAERAEQLRAAGSSLAGRLDELARAYGLHVTAQVSVRVPELAAITAAMAGLRGQLAGPGGGAPAYLSPAIDLLPEGGPLPPTDAVVLTVAAPDAGPVRVVVRPSGTEPKLKLYLEAVRDAEPDLAAQRAALRAHLAVVATQVRATLAL